MWAPDRMTEPTFTETTPRWQRSDSAMTAELDDQDGSDGADDGGATRQRPEKPSSSPDRGRRSVMLRTLSAVVLAPPVVLAFYLGSPYSDFLLLLTGGAVAWEYAHLREGPGALPLPGLALIATVLVTVVLSYLGFSADLVAWFLGLACLGLPLLARQAGKGEGGGMLWYGFGVLYVGLPLLSLQWLLGLGGEAKSGTALLIWLLAMVWSTDIGAYIAGRSLGGPKLIPALSPKKTWSGLFGGMLAAGLVATLLTPYLSVTLLPFPWLFGAILAVVAQAGDFLESGMKRHFKVKNASQLIPGHGGLLDRVDGLISAVLLLSLFVGLEVIVP